MTLQKDKKKSVALTDVAGALLDQAFNQSNHEVTRRLALLSIRKTMSDPDFDPLCLASFDAGFLQKLAENTPTKECSKEFVELYKSLIEEIITKKQHGEPSERAYFLRVAARNNNLIFIETFTQHFEETRDLFIPELAEGIIIRRLDFSRAYAYAANTHNYDLMNMLQNRKERSGIRSIDYTQVISFGIEKQYSKSVLKNIFDSFWRESYEERAVYNHDEISNSDGSVDMEKILLLAMPKTKNPELAKIVLADAWRAAKKHKHKTGDISLVSILTLCSLKVLDEANSTHPSRYYLFEDSILLMGGEEVGGFASPSKRMVVVKLDGDSEAARAKALEVFFHELFHYSCGVVWDFKKSTPVTESCDRKKLLKRTMKDLNNIPDTDEANSDLLRSLRVFALPTILSDELYTKKDDKETVMVQNARISVSSLVDEPLAYMMESFVRTGRGAIGYFPRLEITLNEHVALSLVKHIVRLNNCIGWCGFAVNYPHGCSPASLERGARKLLEDVSDKKEGMRSAKYAEETNRFCVEANHVFGGDATRNFVDKLEQSGNRFGSASSKLISH